MTGLALLLGAALASTPAEDPRVERVVAQVSAALYLPGCGGVCRVPLDAPKLADDPRRAMVQAHIRTLAEAGRGKRAILRYFVERYGKAILDRGAHELDAVGRAVPDLPLPSLVDDVAEADRVPTTPEGVVQLTTLGEPVLVAFWSTWAGPFRDDMETLGGLAERGLLRVGVVHDDDPDHAERFVASRRVPLHPVTDPQGLAIAFGVTGVPEYLLLDAKGTVVAHHRGGIDPTFLEAVDDLLADKD